MQHANNVIKLFKASFKVNCDNLNNLNYNLKGIIDNYDSSKSIIRVLWHDYFKACSIQLVA